MSSQIRWLNDVIPVDQLGELQSSLAKVQVINSPSASLCLLCKGGRMLCGRIQCPIIMRTQSLIKHQHMMDSLDIEGSTPPGVFVGRIGYPKVNIGPMVPPYYGDTGILDTPEQWLGKSIDQIVDYRYTLIRAKVKTHIYEAQSGNRLLDALQEVAMSDRPVNCEAKFTKKPTNVLILSEVSEPYGSSAPLKSFKATTSSVDRRIEKTYYDMDLKAVDAVWDLYRNGATVTRIHQAFSLGMFGLRLGRRLVPTRWSITAVDNSLSLKLIDKVKVYDTVDKFQVYKFTNLDNIFVAILMPEHWRFEWIEAWFPGTAWNPERVTHEAVLMGDYEDYWARTNYASVGGCYYSARLAVAEKLSQDRRQASALVLREIHPGYILPVGVWNVRESVRATLKCEPRRFDTFQSALGYAVSELTIPLRKWVEHSHILQQAIFQKRITDYLECPPSFGSK